MKIFKKEDFNDEMPFVKIFLNYRRKFVNSSFDWKFYAEKPEN